jgi:hypothetical protein
MRHFAILLIAVLALLLPGAMARAEGSLNQMVQELQKNPKDDALREKIIRQAHVEKPAIPEEARRYFVKGHAIAKNAKDEDGQKLAVKSFEEALKVAPWWGDALYNLAVAQELSGQYADASQSLKLYIMTEPGEKEARQAQDRIYTIEGKQDLSKKESVSAQKKAAKAQARKEAAAPSFDGAIFESVFRDAAGRPTGRHVVEIRGTQATYKAFDLVNASQEIYTCGVTGNDCSFDIGNGFKGKIEIAAGGKNAKLTMYFPNGNVGQVISLDRKG